MTATGPVSVRARSAVGIATFVIAGGCERAPPVDLYFPLDPGHRWVYRVTTRLGDAPATVERLRFVGERGAPRVDGETGVTGYRRSDDGVEYWLHADAGGIYRTASRTLTEDGDEQGSGPQPGRRPDLPPRPVVKAPYAVGTEWIAPTYAYLLERRFDTPREVRHAYPPAPMRYRIEDVGVTLATAAGRYDGCLRVQAAATMRVYADPVAGWADMPLTTVEWYCRGVGLARLERSEPASSKFMLGGTQTWELVEFR